jgi:hypothetical protein
MKKPDCVEVGQWWVTRFGGQAPDRVTPDAIAALCAFQSEMSHWIDARDYLGSGDHPEPSEWMIETLAEHAYDIGRVWLPPTWGDYPDEKQTNWRYCVRRTLSGECDILNEQLTDAVLSLYSILRSLGKW